MNNAVVLGRETIEDVVEKLRELLTNRHFVVTSIINSANPHTNRETLDDSTRGGSIRWHESANGLVMLNVTTDACLYEFTQCNDSEERQTAIAFFDTDRVIFVHSSEAKSLGTTVFAVVA